MSTLSSSGLSVRRIQAVMTLLPLALVSIVAFVLSKDSDWRNLETEEYSCGSWAD